MVRVSTHTRTAFAHPQDVSNGQSCWKATVRFVSFLALRLITLSLHGKNHSGNCASELEAKNQSNGMALYL
jgi:hypothetical protein